MLGSEHLLRFLRNSRSFLPAPQLLQLVTVPLDRSIIEASVFHHTALGCSFLDQSITRRRDGEESSD